MRLPLLCLLAFLGWVVSVTAQEDPISETVYEPQAEVIGLRRVTSLNICGNLRLTVPGLRLLGLVLLGITLDESICICLANGDATDQSSTRIRASLTTGGNAGLLPSLINLIGGNIETVIARLISIAEPILSRGSTTCRYPVNAVPDDCSTACRYTCASGMKLCNGLCILKDDSCATGGTAKRKRLPIREDLDCAKGFDACMVPYVSDSKRWNGRSYDCVDTRADLESCGGCAYPMPGRQAGRDCTALPNVADVTCVNSECLVQSCIRGFVLHEGRCIASSFGRRLA